MCGEIIELIKTIPLFVASCVAIYGIDSWLREGKWKRKSELAEEVLSLFYQCEEAIKGIRSPFSWGDEGTTRKRKENENPDDSKLLDMAYIVYERFENTKEPFLRLRVLKFRFMALFGKEHEKYFDEVRKIINTIMTASSQYFDITKRQNKSDAEFARMDANQKIIYFEEDDEITKRMQKAVEDMEKICRATIEHKRK